MTVRPLIASYGVSSNVARLRCALVRPPQPSYGQAEPERWGYQAHPDLEAARREHEALVRVLEGAGVQVEVHDSSEPDSADSHFVCDPFVMTPFGAVAGRMGKGLRASEPEAMAARLQELGVPVIAQVRGDAHLEGGDAIWLDEETLAIGVGFRTDRGGVAELRAALYQEAVELVPVVMPWGQGPLHVLHLGTAFSLVDQRKALLYRPLLPVEFVRWLESAGYQLIDVHPQEWPRQAANALALEPGVVLLASGNPVTTARLEEAGVRVVGVAIDDLGVKSEGGPTCLVAALWRAA